MNIRPKHQKSNLPVQAWIVEKATNTRIMLGSLLGNQAQKENGNLRKILCTAKTKFQNLKQIFPEKEYRGLSPNFHIHVSVSELYIPTMGLPFLLEEICGQILGIYKSLTDT
jgi:hypothetical protein